MSDRIQLPPPRRMGTMSVEEAICLRHSVRSYRANRLADDVLGQLLWSAQGVIDIEESPRRAAPSAGARYPLEAYVATEDLIAHYRPADHSLHVLRRVDVRADLARAALSQEFIQQAPAVIVLTCIAKRIDRPVRQEPRGALHCHGSRTRGTERPSPGSSPRAGLGPSRRVPGRAGRKDPGPRRARARRVSPARGSRVLTPDVLPPRHVPLLRRAE